MRSAILIIYPFYILIANGPAAFRTIKTSACRHYQSVAGLAIDSVTIDADKIQVIIHQLAAAAAAFSGEDFAKGWLVFHKKPHC
jgi:hypothetical protein